MPVTPLRSARPWRWGPQALRRDLQERHHLRLHGLVLGALTLAVMWGASWSLRGLGLHSLAWRYALSLGLGYGAYLLLVRWWASMLVSEPAPPGGRGGGDAGELVGEVVGDLGGQALDRAADATWSRLGGALQRAPRPLAEAPAPSGLGDALGDSLGEVAGSVVGGAADADEAAVVVVPLVVVFVLVGLLLTGAGALALLYFGWDVLLAVAVELAFSYAAGRSATQAARGGWLGAALGLTWKPLLGALLCAVALGAVIDRFIPQAHSLPEAVRLMARR